MSDGEDPQPEDEIVVPIEDELDLHPFRPRDIRNVVRDYLDEAVSLGLPEVRLIHGKGIGFQRDAVRKVLASHPEVIDFGDGGPGGGGWGATVVRLRAAPASAEPGPEDDPGANGD